MSLVVIVSLMAVFAVMAAIMIDYAYMQQVRTEMRTMTDAAAKAGAEALTRTESVAEARAAAIRYAQLNPVANQPFQLDDEDIQVGRLTLNGNDRWEFQEDNSPFNAVRVLARTGEGATHPPFPLFFGSLLGKETFAPSYEATAGQQSVEVCLCLDRSGSMLFDMSGVEYSYPPNNPNLINFTAWGTTWRYHLSPPHPVNSRWAVLARAIDLFMDEAGAYSPPPRTALVTWSSDYTMPVAPGTVFYASTTDVQLPTLQAHNWATNRQEVISAVVQLGSVPMMGATNLSAGLDRAVDVLRGPNSSSFANKVVILLTDGEWNDGRNPVDAAADARDSGITVHCITVLTAHQPDVEQIATLTGGRYYNTYNEQQLREAFQEIARSLPIVLTD